MQNTLQARRIIAGSATPFTLPFVQDEDGNPAPYDAITPHETAALVAALVEHREAVNRMVEFRLKRLGIIAVVRAEVRA